MSGLDFTLLRQQISLTQVLDLVGFTATTVTYGRYSAFQSINSSRNSACDRIFCIV